MQEIPFSVPVSGVIKIDNGLVMVTINRSETVISFNPEPPIENIRKTLGRGKTTFDVILEAAHEFIRRNGFNRFSVSELYDIALEKYPGLKKGSFTSRMVASAPNHPSFKHNVSTRNFLIHMVKGIYRLEESYLAKPEGKTGLFQNVKSNTSEHRATLFDGGR